MRKSSWIGLRTEIGRNEIGLRVSVLRMSGSGLGIGQFAYSRMGQTKKRGLKFGLLGWLNWAARKPISPDRQKSMLETKKCTEIFTIYY
jgi:hypothetical protein